MKRKRFSESEYSNPRKFIGRYTSVALYSITLGGDRTSHSIDDARELHQCSIAHQFDHAAAVLGNPGSEMLVPQCFDRNVCVKNSDDGQKL